MSIKATCSGCGKVLKAPDSAAGRRAKCPACGAPIEIPAAEPVYDAEEIFDEDDTYGLGANDELGDEAEPPIAPPRRKPAGDGKRKPCPMCGEMIAATAAKCRFCGEVFDPELKRRETKHSRSTTSGELTTVDWLLCVLCSGIGCIVGLVAMISGDSERGGKMVGISLVFVFLWAMVRVAIEQAAQR
ncbi:MAG: hypothetical protein KY476_06330 [Planctomycetes bacterium]|nr:hypothetical protein [Planctomycetota bacterium]